MTVIIKNLTDAQNFPPFFIFSLFALNLYILLNMATFLTTYVIFGILIP